MKRRRLTIPMLYIAIGILWITLSDNGILWVADHTNPDRLRFLNIGKGFTFMILTGALLYLLIEKDQRKIIRSEKQYRNFFEGNPNPIWFYDPKTYKFLAVNNAAITRYGYSRKEFLSMTIRDIRPAEDHKKLLDSINNMPHAVKDSGVWRHIKKDGSLIYVNITSHKTQLNGMEAVMVIPYDTTDKILQEQQLQSINAELVAQKKQLAKNYHHLEDTLNSITDSFCTINREWIVTKVNVKFYEITGFQGNIIGRLIYEAFPGMENGSIHQQFKKAMEERMTIKFEDFSYVLNKWLCFSLYPTEEGIAVYFTDVTLEKQKDISLKQALERYDLVASATGDVIYDLDLANETVTFSKQVSALTHIPLENIGNTLSWWRKLIHPSDLQQLRESQQDVINTKQKYWTAEYRVMTDENHYKYVYDQGHILFDDAQQPIRLIGAIKDIDLIKRNTEQIKRLGEILNKITSPVVILDPLGIIIWINPAFTILWEYSESEIIGRTPAEMLHGAKTDKRIIEELMGAVSRQEAYSTELINYSKSKREHWISINLSPIFDADGLLECYISIENDITERKEREAEIAAQNKKLDAVSWLNSHQVRRPVASILALVQLIKTTDNLSEKEEILEKLYLSTLELDSTILEINAEASQIKGT